MPGHRLVEQERLGPQRQRHRDLELAPLAVRRVPPPARPPRPARPTRVERRARPGPVSAVVAQRAAEEAEARARAPCTASTTFCSTGESVADLTRSGRLRASPRARPRRRAEPAETSRPVEPDASPARAASVAGQLADQRRLAGAVRADQRMDFAGTEVEAIRRRWPSARRSSWTSLVLREPPQPCRALPASQPISPPRAKSTTSRAGSARGRSASSR